MSIQKCRRRSVKVDTTTRRRQAVATFIPPIRRHIQAMETDLAYEVLADYSLQETPFYEAPTPTAAVGVNLYPPPNNTHLQTSHQQPRNNGNTNRRYDSAYDLSLASSMLTGKMQLMNTSSSAGADTNVGTTALHGGMHHTGSHQTIHQNQQQAVIALVPIGLSNLSSGSSLTSSISSGSSGGSLIRPKKMKKSVTFLPTFVHNGVSRGGIVLKYDAGLPKQQLADGMQCRSAAEVLPPNKGAVDPTDAFDQFMEANCFAKSVWDAYLSAGLARGCDGDSGPIQLKQEPLDDGPIRNIQKVPSLSDLSDPEASLGDANESTVSTFARWVDIAAGSGIATVQNPRSGPCRTFLNLVKNLDVNKQSFPYYANLILKKIDLKLCTLNEMEPCKLTAKL
uniref:Uncharacterized protein n=1 Tax=Anopheles minimus TaxID=112268 RepID=A0A182VPR1_9DIPT